MLDPLIGVRLHGWLDDIFVLIYLVGIKVLGLHGAAFLIAIGGAAVHFGLARCTRYPQGKWSLLSFRTHAFIELTEGMVVLAAALFFIPPHDMLVRTFLAVMGTAQFGAFALSDYQWPKTAVTAQSPA